MYVCICHGLKERDVRQAVARGADTLLALQQQLGLGDRCGRCLGFARQILDGNSPSEAVVMPVRQRKQSGQTADRSGVTRQAAGQETGE